MLKSVLFAAAAFALSAGVSPAAAVCPPQLLPVESTHTALEPCLPGPAFGPEAGATCSNCPQSEVVKRGDVLECAQPVTSWSHVLIPQHFVKGRCEPGGGSASSLGHPLPVSRGVPGKVPAPVSHPVSPVAPVPVPPHHVLPLRPAPPVHVAPPPRSGGGGSR